MNISDDNKKNGVAYGCHVDLLEGEKPDGCVLDYGGPEDCVYTKLLSGRTRRSKWTCQFWRKIGGESK